MDYYDILIKLYAKHSVVDINTNKNGIYSQAFAGIDYEALVQNPSFINAKDAVEKISLMLAEALSKPEVIDNCSEVSACLRLFLNLTLFKFNKFEESVFKSKMNILKDLVLSKFKSSWNEKQLQHFAVSAEKIVNWKVIFLSYTNKDAKKINNYYKDILYEVLLENGIGNEMVEKHWTKKNLIVQVIVNALRDNGLPVNKIFYDRNDLEAGDDLEKSIFPMCVSSFHLVQLVSERVFVFEDRNWVYDEYKMFSGNEARDRKILFSIVAGKAPTKPVFFAPDYEEWFNRASNKDLHTVIPNTKDEFEKTIASMATTIRTFLYDDLVKVS